MAAVFAARLAALGAAGAATGHLLARAEARSTPPPPKRSTNLSREERMKIPEWAGVESGWETLDLHSRYGESLSGNAVHDTLLVRISPRPRSLAPAPRSSPSDPLKVEAEAEQ